MLTPLKITMLFLTYMYEYAVLIDENLTKAKRVPRDALGTVAT